MITIRFKLFGHEIKVDRVEIVTYKGGLWIKWKDEVTGDFLTDRMNMVELIYG